LKGSRYKKNLGPFVRKSSLIGMKESLKNVKDIIASNWEGLKGRTSHEFHTWEPTIYSGFNYEFNKDSGEMELYFPGTSSDPYSIDDYPWYALPLWLFPKAWSWVWNFLFIPFVIHIGFWWSAFRLRKAALAICKGYDVKKITLVGLSQGGAIATLVGNYISKKSDLDVEVFNVGGPRSVGIITWPFYRTTSSYKVTNIRNNTDIVTSVPFILLGYVTLGERIRVSGNRQWIPFIPSFVDHYPGFYIEGLRKKIEEKS